MSPASPRSSPKERRQAIGWPRDLESIPTIARLTVARNVPCRKCKHVILSESPHFGVTYRGRYGRATSHLCGSCAAKYVQEVYTWSVVKKLQAGIDAVKSHHGAECVHCRLGQAGTD